jgi:hypothetical protein
VFPVNHRIDSKKSKTSEFIDSSGQQAEKDVERA